MADLGATGRRIMAGSVLALLIGCGPGVTPVATPTVAPIDGVVETPPAAASPTTAASPTAAATASPAGPSPTGEPAPTSTPGVDGGMIQTPAGFTIDLGLPPSFRWVWDDISYRETLDGLDPARRTAVEAVGPPMTKYWLDVYAVAAHVS